MSTRALTQAIDTKAKSCALHPFAEAGTPPDRALLALDAATVRMAVATQTVKIRMATGSVRVVDAMERLRTGDEIKAFLPAPSEARATLRSELDAGHEQLAAFDRNIDASLALVEHGVVLALGVVIGTNSTRGILERAVKRGERLLER